MFAESTPHSGEAETPDVPKLEPEANKKGRIGRPKKKKTKKEKRPRGRPPKIPKKKEDEEARLPEDGGEEAKDEGHKTDIGGLRPTVYIGGSLAAND